MGPDSQYGFYLGPPPLVLTGTLWQNYLLYYLLTTSDPGTTDGRPADYNADFDKNTGKWSIPGFQSGLTAAETCIGERITSVKQLISRLAPIASRVSYGAAGRFVPDFWIWKLPSYVPGTPLTISYWSTAPASYWSYCYGFGRGSTKVSCIAYGDQSLVDILANNDQYSSNVPMIAEYGRVIDTIMPFYHVSSRSSARTLGTLSDYAATQHRVYVGRATGGPLNILYAGAGDDAQLGYYVGPPPLVYTGARPNEIAFFNQVTQGRADPLTLDIDPPYIDENPPADLPESQNEDLLPLELGLSI
jgi:hypothetical protein